MGKPLTGKSQKDFYLIVSSHTEEVHSDTSQDTLGQKCLKLIQNASPLVDNTAALFEVIEIFFETIYKNLFSLMVGLL